MATTTSASVAASALLAGVQPRPPPMPYSFGRRPSQRSRAAQEAAIGDLTSAISLSSGSSSPAPPSPLPFDQDTTNTSVQPSPDALWGRDAPAPTPAPLQLPDASMAILPTSNAMSDAVAISKGPGLMRRLSRGAANRLSRRRPSATTANTRDHSSGPVMMRRRSDSQGGLDNARDDLTFDADEIDDDDDGVERAVGDCGELVGLDGAKDGCRTPGSISTTTSLQVAGVGPVIPSALQSGTTLVKVTRKKKKSVKFVLDVDSAKVCWDPVKPSKRFYLDDIREIRVGVDARNYREEFGIPPDVEPRWFTIVFVQDEKNKGGPIRALHLIAPSEHVLELWATTLDEICRYRIDLMASLAGQSEKSTKAHWNHEMVTKFANQPHNDEEERLSLEDIERLCQKLHINCSKKYIRAQFAKADKKCAGSLEYAGFKDFVRRLKERKDVKEIFRDLAEDDKLGLSKDEFLAFLRDEQRVDVTNDAGLWESIFQKYARRPKPKTPSASPCPSIDDQPARMKLEAFSAFLLSSHNSVLKTSSGAELLDRPLNEYFISSSHNTYLLGRQVAGDSSTEAYIRALQRGCRCVEIDCWDGADGRPVVNHGRTLTSKVLFSDCISVIGKYAFSSTPYPLIISLEVHCGPEQQAVMADILKSVLGDRLLSEPFMTNAFVLPSPEDLKFRILVKVKAPEEVDENEVKSEAAVSRRQSGRRQRSLSSPLSRPVILNDSSISAISSVSSIPNSPLVASPRVMSPPKRSTSMMSNGNATRSTFGTTTASASSATEESDSRDGTTASDGHRRKRKPSKIVRSLGDLAVYMRGQKYSHFAIAESKTYNHVFSFSERTFENLCKETELKSQMEKHNMRYLMRVYPAGYRINSSNFDPNKFWRRGVQMVALNWQTYDLAVQMNDAMFGAGSDRTGYVLKPLELRLPDRSGSDSPLDTASAHTKKEKMLVKFSVDVLSAQQLPRSRGMSPEKSIDPYVEIEVYCADDKAKGGAIGEGGLDASARNGLFGVGSPHRRRTKIIQSNGFNPRFNDKFTVSLETKFPSLVFIRWTVWSSADGRSYGDRNGALATFTAKLSSLQQGYRHLPLYDSKGEQFLFSTLFCRIKKEDVVPVETETFKGGRVGSIKQFGRSMFNRTLSAEKRASQEDLRRR